MRNGNVAVGIVLATLALGTSQARAHHFGGDPGSTANATLAVQLVRK